MIEHDLNGDGSGSHAREDLRLLLDSSTLGTDRSV